MKANDPASKFTPEEVTTYAGWRILNAALDKLTKAGTDVTANSVLDTLGGLTDVDTQLTPPFSLNQPFPVASYARLFPTISGAYEVQDGKLTLKQPFKDYRDLYVKALSNI